MLNLAENFRPSNKSNFETSHDAKRTQVFVARSNLKEDFLKRFSSFSRALHVLAYILRFYARVKGKFGTKKSIFSEPPDRLTIAELQQSRELLFRLSKRIYLSEEYDLLSNKKNIPNTSSISSLSPFIGRVGIIRANGRLGSTNWLTYSERHPIILAYHSILARLYVDFIHKMTLHGGLRLVHTLIRQECWIIRAKILIKSIIHNCKSWTLYKNSKQGQQWKEVILAGRFVIRESTSPAPLK